jgi:hypothetical protein
MKFGDHIKVSHRLKRRKREGRAFWDKIPMLDTEVIFLGNRTLTNGFRRWDSDEGWFYVPNEIIKARLVCQNERTAPFYVIREEP